MHDAALGVDEAEAAGANREPVLCTFAFDEVAHRRLVGDDARTEPGEARAGALEDIDDTAEVAEQECRGEAAERAADDGDAKARLTIGVDHGYGRSWPAAERASTISTRRKDHNRPGVWAGRPTISRG